MTRKFLTASVFTVLLGGSALAGAVDDVIAQLQAEGYSTVEVKVKGANTKIEGLLNGVQREILIVTATGEVLSDKAGADSGEGDQTSAAEDDHTSAGADDHEDDHEAGDDVEDDEAEGADDKS